LDLVRRDRPTEPFQIELPDGSCVDRPLHGAEDALTDQGLACLGHGAEPGGEVRDRPERSVVMTTLEADPAACRVPRLDTDPEAELGAELPLRLCQLREPLLGGDRKSDRLEFVILDGERIVEEHHHAVAGEVLEGPTVARDELAQHLVIPAKHFDEFFRRSRLGEGRETAKVAEEAGDVRAVSGEQLLALPSRR
jgi:hypothetical protein